MQDFGAAFNVAFVKRFLTLTKKELRISLVFMGVATFVLMVVFAGAVHRVSSHVLRTSRSSTLPGRILSKQLYQLYLSRGGEPIAISPKLTDLPVIPPTPPPSAPTVPVHLHRRLPDDRCYSSPRGKHHPSKTQKDW